MCSVPIRVYSEEVLETHLELCHLWQWQSVQWLLSETEDGAAVMDAAEGKVEIQIIVTNAQMQNLEEEWVAVKSKDRAEFIYPRGIWGVYAELDDGHDIQHTFWRYIWKWEVKE